MGNVELVRLRVARHGVGVIAWVLARVGSGLAIDLDLARVNRHAAAGCL